MFIYKHLSVGSPSLRRLLTHCNVQMFGAAEHYVNYNIKTSNSNKASYIFGALVVLLGRGGCVYQNRAYCDIIQVLHSIECRVSLLWRINRSRIFDFTLAVLSMRLLAPVNMHDSN